MRDDFHKVIIERPRWGSRRPNLKTRLSLSGYDPDANHDYPTYTGRPKEPSKSFSDRLGPLRRLLRSQVGRPWAKVEGEIRRAFDTRTVIGRHLLDHALRMIERNVRILDGRPVRLDGYPVFRDFYVHPRTGLLLEPKPVRTDPAAARRAFVEKAKEVELDDGTRAVKINGLWYLGEPRVKLVGIKTLDERGRVVTRYVERTVRPRKQADSDDVRRILRTLDVRSRER